MTDQNLFSIIVLIGLMGSGIAISYLSLNLETNCNYYPDHYYSCMVDPLRLERPAIGFIIGSSLVIGSLLSLIDTGQEGEGEK